MDNYIDIVNYIKLYNKLDYEISVNRLTKHFYAGELIQKGRAVYVGADQKIYIVDPSVENDLLRYVGIAETNTPIGGEAIVATHGLSLVQDSGWQSGVVYYVASNGTLTSTPGDKQVGVGVGLDRVLLTSTGSGGGSPSGDCCGSIDGGDADEVYCDFIDGGAALFI